MAAAIVGTRMGAAYGSEMSRQEQVKRASEAQRRASERILSENKLLWGILEVYDEDRSMSLSRSELSGVLRDYAAEVYGSPVTPTASDLDFLFTLCDSIGGNGDGQIDGREILAAVETWGAFVEKSKELCEWFQIDFARGPGASKEETFRCLERMSKAKGHKLPPEVFDWILLTADLDQDGVLSRMEAARAVCALNRWLRSKDNRWTLPARMGAFITMDDDLPDSKNHKSAACTVS
eukprot:TRINITY_DN6314_c0_g4_i1.p1 TRINITY_DN6314_c0_g4~~TRINITY_DN6314_c0_g4_i1.p1  ORF type:complete len:236 (-),score=51.08 TRINITY_DN6314_c0_g4_i1:94-801(-)